jgi:CRP/FNR family cyclic AMP-dependent transcriptional regulator
VGQSQDQFFNSSEKRLARALLLLAQYGMQEEPQKILPKLSQEMLAEMIGSTRSQVNFFMAKFRRLGFIGYDGLYQHFKGLWAQPPLRERLLLRACSAGV